MHSNSTRHLAALLAPLVLALSPMPAAAVLERVGPNDPVNTLPAWFQDKTGITFELCSPINQAELDGGFCLLLPGDTVAPEVFPSAFFDEHFFWGADVTGDWTYVPPVGVTVPATTGRVVYVQAIEAAFLSGVRPGGADMFGRVRFRLDDLPLDGNYTFYTPYGIEVIPGIAGDRIFYTEDIGCPFPAYECVLQTRIGPFLLPSLTPGGAELPPFEGPVPGKKYIANPATTHKVTGSPIVGLYTLSGGRQVNPNGLYIEAPDGQLIFESTDFSLMGRYHTDVIPSRLKVDRASYSRDASSIVVDAFATGEPTMQPRLSDAELVPPVQPQLSIFAAPCAGGTGPQGQLIPPYAAPVGVTAVPMSRSGNVYWAETGAAAVPAAVCLADLTAQNALGQVVPVYVPGALGDQVLVTETIYDPSNGGSLSVLAVSSDQLNPPPLSLGAFGDLLANVPFVNGLAYVSPLAAPPERVRVLSQESGVGERQVVVGSRVATGVTLSADRASPQAPGTAIVFTAQGQGAPGYRYRFLLDTGGGFQQVRDWSETPVWVLGSTYPAGTYRVKAEVWSGLTEVGPDAESSTITFILTLPPATGVSVVPSLPSPQVPGTDVTFTAIGAGSSGYQFRFWLNDGTGWVIVQGYSTTATWTLPGTAAAGTYLVSAEVRTTPSVTRDAASSIYSFVLGHPAATGVTVSADAATPSPQFTGTPVTFTAQGTGSTGTYSYQFWLNDGLGWSIVQPWSTTSTWTLPASSPPGSYTVSVEVRTSTQVTRDALSPPVGFTILPLPIAPATGVTLSTDPSTPSPQPLGTAITFTAVGSGSAGPYQYQFWVNAGTGWSIAQAYGPSATWTLPASAAAGSYTVGVEVRTSSLVTRDATSGNLTFVIQPAAPATGVTVAADSLTPSPQQAGTAVTFTATGTGSPGPYQYQWWVNAGTGWSMVQAWGSDQWVMPSSYVAGTYTIGVEVRTSSLVARDAVSPDLNFELN